LQVGVQMLGTHTTERMRGEVRDSERANAQQYRRDAEND